MWLKSTIFFLLGSVLVFSSSLCAQEETKIPALRIYGDPLHSFSTDHGSAVSILQRDSLVESDALSIGDVLGKLPGVHSSSFAASASRPIIRGFGGERVRVLRNGVGTFDASSLSDDHAVPADALNANSVEIYRGPETLLYGSNAIGGVANIVERSIAEQDALSLFGGETLLRYGSGDDERTGASFVEGGKNGFNYFVSGFYTETNDYDLASAAESRRLRELEQAQHDAHELDNIQKYEDENLDSLSLENSDLRNRGFTLGTSHTWETGYVGISFGGFLSDYGVVGHVHEEGDEHVQEHGEEDGRDTDHTAADGDEGEVRIAMQQYRSDLRGEEKNLKGYFNKIRYALGVATYDHEEFEGEEVATRFENDAFEGRVELSHGQKQEHRGFVGTQFQYADFAAAGEEAFVPDSETFSPALFTLEEFPLSEQFRLQSGARYEYQRVSPSERIDKDVHLTSVSTGILWDSIEKNYGSSLSFSYSERGPTATELFANGIHAATRSYEIGDANLAIERSWGSDLNFSKRTGLLEASVNLFYQQYDNYITLLQSGEAIEGYSVYKFTGQQARFFGYETETKFALYEAQNGNSIDLRAQVDYVRAINISEDRSLPRISPLRAIVELAYTGNGHGASLEGVFVNEQKRVAEGELATSDYQMLNASAYANLPSPVQIATLQLFVAGTNLNDTEARSHTSFLKDIAPLKGRSVIIGVRSVF